MLTLTSLLINTGMARRPLKTTDVQYGVNAQANYFNSQFFSIFSLLAFYWCFIYIVVHHQG